MNRFTVIIFSLSFVAFPNHASDDTKIIGAKCHIELIGGMESINQFYLPATKSGKIDVNRIASLEVSTLGEQKKKSIYQVKECVKVNKKFKSARARNLEDKQVW